MGEKGGKEMVKMNLRWSVRAACVGFLACFVAVSAWAQGLQLEVWPSSSSPPNPLFVVLHLDNGGQSLASLDPASFGVDFDGWDVSAILTSMPLRNYIFSTTEGEIWLGPLVLPAGSHQICFRLARRGGDLVQDCARGKIQESAHRFLFGIHIPPVEDWNEPYTDWEEAIGQFNRLTGRNHGLVGYFASWKDETGAYVPFNDFLNDQIADLGAIPLVTWEPWQAGAGVNQPAFSLQAIASGLHDAYLWQFADACRAFGKPVMLRTMHEFNGVYYPWSGPNNGDRPDLYIAAFRHIVGIFRLAGAKNVFFMWSPNYACDARVSPISCNIELFYPGDDVVDYIGVSGSIWGSDPTMQAQGWLSFNEIFDNPTFGSFLSKMEADHPQKPLIIAEIGCNDDPIYSKAQWIVDAYQQMFQRPNVVGAVWFNNKALHDAAHKWADFRIIANPGDSDGPDPSALAAYRRVVQ